MIPRRHTSAAITRTTTNTFHTFSSKLQPIRCTCCLSHLSPSPNPFRPRRRVPSAPFSTSLWYKKETRAEKVSLDNSDECDSAKRAYESNLDDVLRSLVSSTISSANLVRGFSWERGEAGTESNKRESATSEKYRRRTFDRRRSASLHSSEDRDHMKILLPGQAEPITLYRKFTALFQRGGTDFDSEKQAEAQVEDDGKLQDDTEKLYADNILQVLDSLPNSSSASKKENTVEDDVDEASVTKATRRPALEWAGLIRNARDLETVENLERELVVAFSDLVGLPGITATTTTTTTTVGSIASLLPPKLLARRRRIRFLLNNHLLEKYIRFRDVSGAKRTFERIRVYALWGIKKKKSASPTSSGDSTSSPIDDEAVPPNANDRAETVPASHIPVLTRAYHSYIEALLRVGTWPSLKEATIVLGEASEFGLEAQTGRDFATEILLLSRTRDVDRLEFSWKRMEKSGCEVSLIAYGAYAGCMSDAGRSTR